MKKTDNGTRLVNGCAILVLIYMIACMVMALVGCNYQRALTKNQSEKNETQTTDSATVSKTNNTSTNIEDWERIIERIIQPPSVVVLPGTNLQPTQPNIIERIIERGSSQQSSQANTYDSGALIRIAALEEKSQNKQTDTKIKVLSVWHLIAVTIISIILSLLLGKIKVSFK